MGIAVRNRYSRALRLLMAGLAVLGGCAPPIAMVTQDRRLEVFVPAAGASLAAMPGNWLIAGATERMAVVEKDGVPALRLVNGTADLMVVRRIRAVLLAAPYLNWAWNLAPHDGADHPVRLVVGFRGGAGNRPRGAVAPLPSHDRLLALTWSASALRRGDLTAGKEGGPSRYASRGGRENVGAWWAETVDLAEIYARAWPDDDLGRVALAFIGAWAPGGRRPAVAYVSGMVLSR